MNVSLTARDLEPVHVGPFFCQIAGLHTTVNIVGPPSERLGLLSDCVALEMDAADLHDHDTIQALKRMIEKVDKSLKASDIPKPK